MAANDRRALSGKLFVPWWLFLSEGGTHGRSAHGHRPRGAALGHHRVSGVCILAPRICEVFRHQRLGEGISGLALSGLVPDPHRRRRDRGGPPPLRPPRRGDRSGDYRDRHARRHGHAHLVGAAEVHYERNAPSRSRHGRRDRPQTAMNGDLAEVVERARNDDLSIDEQHAAFAELVRRFEESAFGWALQSLDNPVEAKDATPDAFITAWAKLRQLRAPAAFGAWLKRLIASQCNRRKRSRPIAQLLAEHGAATNIEYERIERQRLLAAAIAKLSEREYRV